MPSWPTQSKLFTKLRRRSDKPDLARAGLTAGDASAAPVPVSDDPSRRSAEFLEFAQAAGGFGVFELNLASGHIRGTSLFFELIGLECRDMSLTREQWLASIHPEDLEGVLNSLNEAAASGGGYASCVVARWAMGCVCE